MQDDSRVLTENEAGTFSSDNLPTEDEWQ